MSDIVERLREYAKDWRTRAADASPCKEAADEIDRLREALETIAATGPMLTAEEASEIAEAALAKEAK